MWPWRVKMPTQNLLRLFLLPMLMMMIMLATICCSFWSWGLVINFESSPTKIWILKQTIFKYGSPAIPLGWHPSLWLESPEMLTIWETTDRPRGTVTTALKLYWPLLWRTTVYKFKNDDHPLFRIKPTISFEEILTSNGLRLKYWPPAPRQA